MSLAKPAIVCGLATIVLSGCGIAAKPEAGSPKLPTSPGFHGRAASLVPARAACLTAHGLRIHAYTAKGSLLPVIQIGTLPSGPTMVFEPDSEAAEGAKIEGRAQGAELIGPVLLYPNGASLSEAKVVEQCAAIGVP